MNVTETAKSMRVESKILGDAQILEFRDICMDFEPRLKVHPLISVQHKCTGLGQMTHLNKTFHVVVSHYQLVKMSNLPQFLAQHKMTYIIYVNKAILPLPVSAVANL